MNDMHALLLSNSSDAAGYLTTHLPAIQALAAGCQHAVFVPYAGVTRGWDEYADLVQNALAPAGLAIQPLHTADDPQECLRTAEMIIVGGGNTFSLLHHLRRQNLLPVIRAAVQGGQARYLGWSAGSNLACPSICTTNDMPIVDPGGFDALELVPFQINPHFTNSHPPGHRGETRVQRLREFCRLSPAMPVVALPEGTGLRIEGQQMTLIGGMAASLFLGEAPEQTLNPGILQGLL